MRQQFFTLILSLFAVSAFAQDNDASFPIELNGGYIDFNDDGNFRDTWYAGAASGFNFSENAGIRGYYWKAIADDAQKDNNGRDFFDNLEIYGAETIVKAPITDYFRPYLITGGGLMKPYGNYEGENGLVENDSKFFGTAGAGLDLSFINFLSVTGYARAMVMNFEQLNDVGEQNTNITTSWNYGGSINFRIGDRKNGKFIRNSAPMPSKKEVKKEEKAAEKEQEKIKKEAIEEVKADLEKDIKSDFDFEEVRQIRVRDNTPLTVEEKIEINKQIDSLLYRIARYEANMSGDEDALKALEEELRNKKYNVEDYYGVPEEKLPVTTEKPQPVQEPVKIVIEDKRNEAPATAPVTTTPVVDIDRDKDGIVDDIDKCPNVAGPMSNEGCPINQKVVQTPAPAPTVETRYVEVERQMNFLAQSVFFDFDSARITGASERNLNEIYNLMMQNPNTTYVIEGHTDSVGDAGYNKNLSQKRAQAVVNYLVSKGMSTSKLSAIGYGEEQPIASNATKEGREQNRRVVIKLKY